MVISDISMPAETQCGADVVKVDHIALLSPKVLGKYCQVSRTTVVRWIKDGKLQAFRLPSGHYRIDKEDFRAFLERYDMPIKEELFGSESKKEGGEE